MKRLILLAALTLAPYQPTPTIAIVLNAHDYHNRGIMGTRIVADPGGIVTTDAEGRAAVYLPLTFRGSVAIAVRWPNGCTRAYTWLQSNGYGPQVIYVNAAECR